MGDKYLNKSKECASKLFRALARYEATVAGYIPQAQDNLVNALENKMKVLRDARKEAREDLIYLKIQEEF